MSIERGRRMFANRGGSKPSAPQIGQPTDYAALGKGALLSMARHGDRDARAALIKLGEPDPPDPDAA